MADRQRQHSIMTGMRGGQENRPPTQAHRPILTMGMLGTVYGISPRGDVRYFDYRWEEALEFAGVSAVDAEDFRALDLRFGSPRRNVFLRGYDMWHPERKISKTEKAYWVLAERNRDE